ncbi:hypothetical protein HHI36_022042, partial [Cryptolaemus montrouzieri]
GEELERGKLEDLITSLEARETSGGVEVSGFSNLHLDNVNDFRPVIKEIANDLLQCCVRDSDLLSCHRVDNKKGSVLVARFSSANIRGGLLKKRKGKRIESNMLIRRKVRKFL